MLSSKLEAINNVSQKLKNKHNNHPEKTPFREDIDRINDTRLDITIDNNETTTSTAPQSESESEKEQAFKKRRFSRLFSWIKKT